MVSLVIAVERVGQVIGMCESSNFYEYFGQMLAEHRKDKKEWVTTLRAEGYKAAHPNDGWVDRESNEVCFMYPYFNDNVGIGDRVMLGRHHDRSSWRSVRLTGKRISNFIEKTIWWKFEDE